MKTWQTLAICFSILLSIFGSTFYIKYEPKTILNGNYGQVDLGKVFAEKVMVDVSVIGLNKENDVQTVANDVSYFDKNKPIDSGFLRIFDLINVGSYDKDKISYENATPKIDKFKLRVKTYISYSSSNFSYTPYVFMIKDETYSLPKGKRIKESVENIMNKNFENTKSSVGKNLFFLDKKEYGLLPE